jgi:DNA-binding LacI/PurR family transcriptional regulator
VGVHRNRGDGKLAITIKDLAQMANTSTATVSRVLSDKPGVTEEKRKRILELAQRLGYSPNRIAQNLALQKSHVLGLIAADLRNTVYVDFLRRMQGRVEELGYQVLIADSELNPEMERHNISVMRQHRAEGLIIFPVLDYLGETQVEHLLELKLQRFPFVIVGRIEGFGFDFVISEETETAYKLTRRLIELGHRRIAFIGYRDNNRPVRERFEGMAKAMRESGLEVPADFRVSLGENDEWLPDLV